MPFLPEWAPSVHPLIIHFPIALLLLALVFDVLFLIFRKHRWLNNSANALYILGGLGAVAAFFSGRQAADLAEIPAFVHTALSEHADLGLYTAWFFGIYGVFRLLGWWQQWYENVIVLVVSTVIGLGGAVLLFETAEHGAALVYRYGIGVKAAETARREAAEKADVEEALSEGGIVPAENGGWKWQPQHGADLVLKQQFNWVLGDAESLQPQATHDETAGEVLELKLRNNRVLFTAGAPLDGVQLDVKVNLDNFKGSFMLVHHVQDGHFRGYLNEKLVTHGHAKDLPPGATGLLIDGSGTVLLDEIVVQAIQ